MVGEATFGWALGKVLDVALGRADKQLRGNALVQKMASAFSEWASGAVADLPKGAATGVLEELSRHSAGPAARALDSALAVATVPSVETFLASVRERYEASVAALPNDEARGTFFALPRQHCLDSLSRLATALHATA